MSCNIIFDYISPHNNEYWYKCTTCGAKDWFAYYDKPKANSPFKDCHKDDAQYLERYAEEQELIDLTPKQLIEQIIKQRRYIEKLEEFQEDVYECYPDCSYDLMRMREQLDE
jgi:hypothetical protein